MKISKILAALLFSLGFTTIAQAANDVTLTDFQVWSLGAAPKSFIRVIPKDVVSNPNACTDPDSYMVSTSISADGQNRNYTTLIAAKLADKPVAIRVEGCENNRPAITAVFIK